MRLILIFLFALTSLYCQAQVIKREFRNQDGKKSREPEAAYVFEYIVDPDHADYYIRTKKNMEGNILEKISLSMIEPDIKDGESATYYEENGNVESQGDYQKGTRSGIWKYYYDNGSLKERVDFDVPKNKDLKFKILDAYDSLGNQIVKNGKGNYVENFGDDIYSIAGGSEKPDGIAKGMIFKGYKTGVWNGEFFKSGDTFEERWEKGKFISGERIDSSGQEINYEKIWVMPEPIGGMTSFYRYIASTLRYPDLARRMNVQGKVFVQFVVDKAGDLTEIQVVKGIGAGCDEEVLRVMKLAQPWNAGYYRGKPVKVRMILPVTFKLS